MTTRQMLPAACFPRPTATTQNPFESLFTTLFCPSTSTSIFLWLFLVLRITDQLLVNVCPTERSPQSPPPQLATMDIAYDHIQEEALTPEQAAQKSRDAEAARQSDLNTELKETYKSLAATSWGQSLGGFFSDVKKQSETFIDEAKQEAGVMQGEAFRGFTGLKDSLVGHARSMSGTAAAAGPAGPIGDEEGKASGDETEKDRTQSEALRESEGMISKFRAEATKRLKELEKAEEAADAAIFRFGANIGNFLKEAVTVAGPETTESQGSGGKVLFESRDVDGKRVIHSTRFEAQLHAVHSSLESFTKDPESTEYAAWKDSFNIDSKTAAIAKDLEKYPELRVSMEKLVPEKVEYPVFWTRYYFLRMVVETEEERRREILKGKRERTSSTSRCLLFSIASFCRLRIAVLS